ncbi:MAG: aminoacyl-tRNA hydrolase [Thermacetogeniaceae bacterium]
MLGWLRELFGRRPEEERPGLRLVCGLGNPGEDYADTRHNAGYMVVERLRSAHGGSWRRFDSLAQVCSVEIGGTPVLLVQPLTYINSSGRAVQPLVRRWGVSPGSLLVVSDDLDLPFGAIRLRPAGSSGGHRGIQSVIDCLGTQEFPRLRIGIGRPPEGVDAAEYVLSPFSPEERGRLEEILELAAEAAACWAVEGVEAAMSRYNRRA